ncbi:hypothetical protein JG687_00001156 [Phytophthora cactorum]|uniref:Uncharacterized protein n=1 Tax=Phytophthora cactorum TaxID=29920 RepID=A0A8T1UY54_9STRA|nr:hypothetical protein JG687_00001156 [Phytophthora cactorum]
MHAMTSHPRVHEWQKLLLRPDIANCLAFSKLRCLISIISLLLLATDIPRSGLGVRRLDQFYAARLKPDTAVRFGPFDYPVRHIWRSKNAESNDADSFRGLEGSDLVDSANVWSYKYDTTSVGLRGAVELLNVTGYPGYLLYRGDVGKKNNHRATLALNTTFLMLDAFITTAQTRVQPESNVGTSWRTFRFATKHIWVDRAYQYLTQFIKRIKLWSLHSLHVLRVSHPTNSLRICIKDLPHPQLQPRFCTYSGIWECENPLNASLPPVRISEQMDIRFRDLQRRYPDLTLDVAILSTHRPSMTSGTLSFTFFNCEEQEIVVLTRGRRCSKNETRHTTLEDDECTTVFVDDYRYERNILQTNVADWYFFIAAMRAAAQGYFWARLILLYHTAFLATKELGKDRQHWYTRVVSAILVVFKIPFQVIVYSSLLPVVGYVLALLLDGNFMDIFLDSYWSTLEGASNFEIMSFLKSAMTQMRTVWLMALLVDLMVFVTRKRINGSEEKIPGIRGLAISFTSALTVIGPYRQTTFRNTELVKAIRLPDIGQRMDTVQSTPQWFFNESTYMFDGSMTMLIVCIGAVVIITSAVRLVSFYMRADQGLVLISTVNVPYGTEFLWPTSSLSVRFNALINSTVYQYDRCHMRPSIAKNSPEPQYLPASPVLSAYFSNSKVSPSPYTNFARLSETATMVSLQSRFRRYLWIFCSKKRVSPTAKKAQPPIGGLCSRTVESQSILQLMNIAMMTDPWNFFWLRVLGIQLYLYRIRPTRSIANGVDDSGSLLPYAVVLPYPEDEMEERTGLSSDNFRLLDSSSSRDLPMSVLLQCG